MNSVPKLFSCCYADCWAENHFSEKFSVLTINHTHSHPLFRGCVSRWFGRALAWHARGQRFDPAILHQKSTVFRRKYGAFLFLFQQKDQGVHRSPYRRASDTPDLHNSRHLPRRFNRGFRGQHGAGPTAPAPAWQALAGARAVRQRGRRRKKKFLRRKVCVAAVVSPGKMARRFTSFWERSI